MRNYFFIGLLCLCALLAGGLLRSAVPTVSAQSISPASTQAGRYSIAANGSIIYFADTQTGRLWYYSTGLNINEKGETVKAAWQEMPSPVVAASQKP